MKETGIKTPLIDGESLLICHKGTIMNGVRVSGQLALTNQRLIWEKGGLANIVGLGFLSLAGTDYLAVPVTEIISVSGYWIPAAAGMKFKLKSGQELKFQLNGSKPKKAREEFINYINNQNYEGEKL